MELEKILEQIGDRPAWMSTGRVAYLTITGSQSYGTANEKSDTDYYGFCLPPIEIVFPHTAGAISGFGHRGKVFEQYQAQHVNNKFDITIYNIVKYFQLVMDGNPNMVDSLFTDYDDVVYMNEIGKRVRSRKHLFLSQKMYHTFRGMVFSQISKAKSGKGRPELVAKYGYDTKDAAHALRVATEMSQVLFTGDLNLKAISGTLVGVRNGKYTLDQIELSTNNILRDAEERANKYVVPYSPPENDIKDLLMECLEMEYGSLSKFGVGVL